MILRDIETELKAYGRQKTRESRRSITLISADDLLEKTQRTLQYERPDPQYLRSIQKWLDVHGCIHRAETEFLQREDDLLALAPPSDHIVSWLEEFVSRRLAQFRGVCCRPVLF